MMIYLIILGIVVVSLVVIKLVTNGLTENVNYAFVEDPTGEGKTIAIKRDRNKTIYKEGKDIINLTGYNKFIIHGLCLEKVGLADGDYIYTKKLDLLVEPNGSIFDHFVVLYLPKEQPDDEPVEGYRVRKAIAIWPTNLDNNIAMLKISDLIENDDEIKDKFHYGQMLLNKYNSASCFYGHDDYLIVSFIYKKGKEKDYSFHPLKFLFGVVKYKSDN